MTMSGRNTQIAAQRASRLIDLESNIANRLPRLSSLSQIDVNVTEPYSESSDFIPSSSQDSNETFDLESGEEVQSVTLSSKELATFDVEVDRDSLLLWLMESPELCQKVLLTVPFRQEGWCKIATKAANQYGYVRISCLGGKGGHDLIEVNISFLYIQESPCQIFTYLKGTPFGAVGGREI